MCHSDPDLRQPLLLNVFRGAYRRAKSFSLSEEMMGLNIDMWESDDLLEMDQGWPTGSPTRLSKTHSDLDNIKFDKEVRKGVMEVHTVQGISWKNEMKSYAFRHGGEIGFRTPAKMVFQGGEKEIYERITGAREKVTPR